MSQKTMTCAPVSENYRSKNITTHVRYVLDGATWTFCQRVCAWFFFLLDILSSGELLRSHSKFIHFGNILRIVFRFGFVLKSLIRVVRFYRECAMTLTRTIRHRIEIGRCERQGGGGGDLVQIFSPQIYFITAEYFVRYFWSPSTRQQCAL